MAKSGSKKGSVTRNSSMYEYWLEYSYTQSIENNSSTVTVKHYWKQIGNQNGTFDSSANRNYGITIAGKAFEGAKRMDYSPWPNDATISTATHEVEHNPDGTKTITISTYANGTASSYGPSNGTASSGNCTASIEITLEPIPREAQLLSATNFTDETNPTITYSNPAGNAADVQVSIHDTSGQTAYVGYRSISKTGTSYTFPLTNAEKAALRAAMPSGKNKMYVNIYIKTYVNGQIVGNPRSLTREFTIVEQKPVITCEVIDIGEYSINNLTKDSSVMIKGFNHIRARMTVDSKKGPSLLSHTITNGSTTINATRVESMEGEVYQAEFPNTDFNNFTFYVKDSYGFDKSEPINMTPVEYVKLTCNLTTNPPTADGDLAIKIHGNYFNNTFGSKGVQNTLDLKWRIKENDGEYGDWTVLTPAITDNTYSNIINLTGLNYKSSYTVQAYAKDLLVSEAVLSPERVTKSEPVFNWGENNFDINVPLTVDNISGSNIFNNTVEQGGLEQGNYDSGTGEKIDGATYYRNRNFIEVEPNAKYVIAVDGEATPFVILHYDENQNFINEARGNSVFVVPSNCKYINFRCYQHYYNESWGFLKITISKADPIQLPSGSLLADLIYPVGSVYMSVNSVNPGFMFGGVWEQIKDRFLLAAGSSYSAGSTGGEAKHTLTINEMPVHNHNIYTSDTSGYVYGYLYTTGWNGTTLRQNANGISTAYTNDNGGGAAHNNMPPYLAVYMWKRIA